MAVSATEGSRRVGVERSAMGARTRRAAVAAGLEGARRPAAGAAAAGFGFGPTEPELAAWAEGFPRRHAAARGLDLGAKGAFQVTECAAGVAGLVGGLLERLRAARNPFVAACLADAAQHAAAMYRLLPPVAAPGAPGDLEAALVYSNDCKHVAETALAFLAAHRREVACPVAALAAEARALRRAGEAAANDRLMELNDRMLDTLDGAEGFRHAHRPERRRKIELALGALATQLDVLGEALRGLLRPFDYVKAISTALQLVLDRIVRDLLELRDISVEESEALPALFKPLLGAAVAAGRGHGGGEGGEGAPDLMDAVGCLAPSLKKLKQLISLFDAPLVDIVKRWETGLLGAVGFTAPELAWFVRAVFEDTELRRASLARIEA